MAQFTVGQISKAKYPLNYAYEQAAIAAWAREDDRAYHAHKMAEHLREAAEALGFDLVPQSETQAEAAE